MGQLVRVAWGLVLLVFVAACGGGGSKKDRVKESVDKFLQPSGSVSTLTAENAKTLVDDGKKSNDGLKSANQTTGSKDGSVPAFGSISGGLRSVGRQWYGLRRRFARTGDQLGVITQGAGAQCEKNGKDIEVDGPGTYVFDVGCLAALEGQTGSGSITVTFDETETSEYLYQYLFLRYDQAASNGQVVNGTLEMDVLTTPDALNGDLIYDGNFTVVQNGVTNAVDSLYRIAITDGHFGDPQVLVQLGDSSYVVGIQVNGLVETYTINGSDGSAICTVDYGTGAGQCIGSFGTIDFLVGI